ncbi:MAG: hypothetical protein AB7T07_15555 [Steroidobacteraceae bacterium]
MIDAGNRIAGAMLSLLMLTVLSACVTQLPQPSTVAVERPDFTGLWKIAAYDLIVKPENDTVNLTEEAQHRLKNYMTNYDWKGADIPVKFCMPHGMPWIMLSRARDYLFDIYQTPDRITMLFEGMDVHRLIRLDQTAVPEAFVPSTNGYSLGRWEGSTLVIETSSLRPTNEVVGSYQRSGQMHITERWRLIDHAEYGRALEVDMTVVDPVIFRKPAHGYQLFVPAEPGSVLNAYACNESLWDDHVLELESQRTKNH